MRMRLAVLCTWMLAVSFGAAMAATEEPRPWLVRADSLEVARLETRVDSLCWRARYEDALHLLTKAFQIRTEKQPAWNEAEWWEVTTARLTLESLRRIAALDDSAQVKLAWADSAADHLAEISKAGAETAQGIVDVRAGFLPRGDIALMNAQMRLGNQLRGTNQFRTASDLLAKVLADAREFLPEKHPFTASALLYYGWALKDQARFEDAEKAYVESLDITKYVFGPDHVEVAEVLSNYVSLLTTTGRLDEAEKMGKETLRIRRAHSEDRAHLADALNDLAQVKYARQEYKEAVAGHEEVLKLLLSTEAPKEWIAGCHANLAADLRPLGQFDRSRAHLLEAMRIDLELYGEENLFVADDYSTLGGLAQESGDFAAAESCLVKSVAICKKVAPGDPWRAAALAQELGKFYRDTGRFDEASQVLEECVTANRAFYPGDHSRISSSLVSLGVLYLQAGDLFEAEAVMREAVAMDRRLFAGDQYDTATALHNLGRILSSRGEFEEADRYLTEALGMAERKFGPDAMLPSTIRHNIGINFDCQGKSAEAADAFRESLRIRRTLVPKVPRYRLANTERSLADELIDLGKYEEAHALLDSALISYDREPQWYAVERSFALSALAKLELQERNYDAAARAADQCLESRLEALGESHQDVGSALVQCASVELARKDYRKAAGYLRRAMESAEAVRGRVLGDELARAQFSDMLGLTGISEWYAYALCRLGKYDEAVFALEHGRGRALMDLLSRSDTDVLAQARARLDTDELRKLDQLLKQQGQHDQQIIATEGKFAALYRRKDIDEKKKSALAKQKRQEILRLRNELNEIRGQVQAELRLVWPEAAPVAFKDVTRVLQKDQVALSYVWCDDFVFLLAIRPDGNVKYALLADSRAGVGEMQQLVLRVREWIAHPPTGIDRTTDLNALYERLIPPDIRPFIMGASRVIVTAGGPLVDIPFEALVTGREPAVRYWIDDGPEVVYVQSLGVYVNRLHKTQTAKRDEGAMVVVANPVFGSESVATIPSKGALLISVMAGGNAEKAGLQRGDVVQMYDGQSVSNRDELDGRVAAIRAAVEKGERSPDKLVNLSYWRQGTTAETAVLPARLGVNYSAGNLEESVRSLDVTMRGGDAVKAEVSALEQVRLYGANLEPLPGTEREGESVARACQKYNVECKTLYGPAATVTNVASTANGARFLHIATHGLTGSESNPYDASLALTRPVEPSVNDIGFLTLRDIIRDWRGRLSGCQLVVLSACDTQRGVRKGDSVMSLPWGFMYAGAPAVVASLWRVADQRTADFMGGFYEEMMSHPERDKLTSFTIARKAFRAQNAHPYYWAPFVYVGAPH